MTLQSRTFFIFSLLLFFTADAKVQAEPQEKVATVESSYPRLASGVLVHAGLADLPKGMLLRCGELAITLADLDSEVEKAPTDVREELGKNGFFLLEQLAVGKLLLLEAKKTAGGKEGDPSAKTDRQIIEDHLRAIAVNVEVTEKEIIDFYRNNKDMFGGASLEQVKRQLTGYLRGRKQQEAVTEYIRTLGQKTSIEVSAAWVKEQAVQARNNPVDKARASGRPSMVDFGRHGCGPCDMMTPILAALREKYDGTVNILFVHVGEEQILAARYGVQSIPIQVFFDKDGKEVFRHAGFFPQEEIEEKLAEMGVK